MNSNERRVMRSPHQLRAALDPDEGTQQSSSLGAVRPPPSGARVYSHTLVAMTLRQAASCATLSALLTSAPLSAQSPKLRDVVARLDAYLESFERQMQSVVGEEEYRQTLVVTPAAAAREPRGGTGAEPSSTRTRTLRSDYALMRVADDWIAFRDTFAVDGAPVRDHDGRLQRLLASDEIAAAAQIVRESARFNLGSEYVVRTINVPTLVLQLLHPRNHSRFSFTHRGVDTIDGIATWRLDYDERGHPTIVRTPNGRDRRSHGSIWVDPQTGAVLRTEIAFDDEIGRGSLTVGFGFVPGIPVRVPLTMSERYRNGDATLTGEATYSNFRQFQTGARIVQP
jgi:hypothetical protein